MGLQFYKYQGAGNDFVIIDNRKGIFDGNNRDLIARLCDRRFGIGADGLMLLQENSEYDFEMLYYNSDGNEGSLCGNGGRCIAAFAHFKGIIRNTTQFIAIDGLHEAELTDPEYVRLKMNDITTYEQENGHFYLDTGSPHYVVFTNKLSDKNVYTEGRKIRYNDRFSKEGTNVNFVEFEQEGLFVRTYERGVEDETFACGTGIVASAISAVIRNNSDIDSYKIRALGGNLRVSFTQNDGVFTNIWLEGPACQVYSGKIVI